MNTAAWLILLLPLFSAVVIGLGAFRSRKASAAISVGAVTGSFLLTLLLIAAGGELHPSVTWLAIEGLQIDIGLQIDTLSKLMLCVVTGVGGLIHIFSLGYMKEDRDFSRYFAFLSLFMFSMIGIVLADNFVMMFIFWELVGISSYLLIGFWFEKPSAADAAKKAFLTNRVGDFGFLLGILMVWAALGSVGFADLAKVSLRRDGDDHRLGRVPDFLRGDGQVCAVSAARLATGRDGRSDAGQRAHPRRDDGGCWRVHALPRVFSDRWHVGDGGDRMDRRIDLTHGSADGRSAGRYQAHPGLLDALTTGLHGDGGWAGFARCGYVSPEHARLFQGVALPRGRLGDRGATSRAGHLENGRFTRAIGCPEHTGRF